MATVSSGFNLDETEYNWLTNVSFHVQSDYDGHAAEITVQLSQDSDPSVLPTDVVDDRPFHLPCHPHALISDPSLLRKMLQEIPYCMYKNYQVQKHMIDVGDKDSMYRFGSCIIYLTAFCGRIAYENRSWFDLPIDVEFYGNSEKNTLKQAQRLGFEIKSTVWAETLRWIRSLGNIWRTNVPYVAGIDICEGARGLYTLPGSKIDPKMLSLVNRSPYMLEWAERHMYFDGKKPTPFLSRNKAEKWSDITKITTLQWNVATDATELLRWCVRMVCLSMDLNINYIEKEKTTGRGKKAAGATKQPAKAIKQAKGKVKRVSIGVGSPLIKMISPLKNKPHPHSSGDDAASAVPTTPTLTPQSPRIVFAATSPKQRAQMKKHLDSVAKMLGSPSLSRTRSSHVVGSPLPSTQHAGLFASEETAENTSYHLTPSPISPLTLTGEDTVPLHGASNTQKPSDAAEPQPHQPCELQLYETPRRLTRAQLRRQQQQLQLAHEIATQPTIDAYFTRIASPSTTTLNTTTTTTDTTAWAYTTPVKPSTQQQQAIPPSPLLQTIQRSILTTSPALRSPVIARRVTRHMVRNARAEATGTTDGSTRVLSPCDQRRLTRTADALTSPRLLSPTYGLASPGGKKGARRVAGSRVRRSMVPVKKPSRSRTAQQDSADGDVGDDHNDARGISDDGNDSGRVDTIQQDDVHHPISANDQETHTTGPQSAKDTTDETGHSRDTIGSITHSPDAGIANTTSNANATTHTTAADAPSPQPAPNTPVPLYHPIDFDMISYPKFTPTVQKTKTITTLHEAMIYCVTHIILVLSEFGSRPILRKQCSQRELEYLSSLLARWLLYIAQDYPVSHPLNREIVTEIVCSLYIAKHNGVVFTPTVLRAMIATVELCVYDAETRNSDAMRYGPCTAKECTYIPLICYNQGKGKADASFAQYHTHFLIGLLFQLAVIDSYGGNGSNNHPELDPTAATIDQTDATPFPSHDATPFPSHDATPPHADDDDAAITCTGGSGGGGDLHHDSDAVLKRCSITPDTLQYAYLYHHINTEYSEYQAKQGEQQQQQQQQQQQITYDMDLVTKHILTIKRHSSSDYTTYPTGFNNIFSPDLYNPLQCDCCACVGKITVIPQAAITKCQHMCRYSHAPSAPHQQTPPGYDDATIATATTSRLLNDVSALYLTPQPYHTTALTSYKSTFPVNIFTQTITDVYGRYKLWTESYLSDPSQTRLKLLPRRTLANTPHRPKHGEESDGDYSDQGDDDNSNSGSDDDDDDDAYAYGYDGITRPTDKVHTSSDALIVDVSKPTRSRSSRNATQPTTSTTTGEPDAKTPPPPQLQKLKQLLITSYFTQYQPALISQEGFGQSTAKGSRRK